MQHDDQTASPPAEAAPIPSDLGPAQARAARDDLLAALAAARKAGGPFAVELDGDTATLPALQLLVAAERSATAAGIAFRAGARAAAVRAALIPDTPNEQEQP